jgi:nascent polypeptide-associated complex subunit alpha
MIPGMGGLDPKKMKGMMDKLGVKTTEINADEVIIKGQKNYVIKNPQVTVIDFQGNKSFQIAGEIHEEEKGISEDDIKLVMEKTGSDREKAKAALENTKGDIAQAIIDLG